MRPLRVSMQAFGPFLDETVCDFSALGDSRIFLITGPTGSGKTTVLDAMSCALYGEPTGSVRRFAEMRSRLAPDSLDTQVVFDFLLGAKKYRFLLRMRIHRKRDGETEPRIDGEYRVFEGEDWESAVPCTKTALAKKAEELLGFSHSQFTQVIILPQGEFRRLLTANSTDKEKILKVLFATGRWNGYVMRIKSRRDAVWVKLAEIKTKIGTLLQSAESASTEELEEKLKSAAEEMASLKNQASEWEKRIAQAEREYSLEMLREERFVRLEEAEKRKSRLESRKKEMAEKRSRAARLTAEKELYPYDAALKAAENTLAKRREVLKRCAKELEEGIQAAKQSEKLFDEIPDIKEKEKNYRAEALKIEQMMPELRRMNERKKQLEELEKRLISTEKEIPKLEAESDALKERAENGERYMREREEACILPLAGYLKEQAELSLLTEEFRRLKEAANQLEKLEGQRDIYRRKSEAAEKLLEDAEKRLKELERSKRLDTAYELAETLSEEEPCPVCGSRHHPAPAKPAESSPDAREISGAASAVETLRAALLEHEKLRSSWQGELDSGRQRLEELRTKLDGNKEPEILERLKALNAEIEKCNKFKSDRTGLLNSLAAFKEKLEEKRAALMAKRLEQRELLAGCAAAKEELNGLQSRLGELPDYEILTARREKAAKSAAECEKKLREIQENRETALRRYSLAVQAEKNAAAAVKEAESEEGGAAAAFKERAAALRYESGGGMKAPNDALISALKEEISDYDAELKNTGRVLGELKTLLEGAARPELKKTEDLKNECRRKMSEMQTKTGEVSQMVKGYESTLHECNLLAAQNALIETQYGQLARIYRYLSGEIHPKINIQSFVLGLMLDEVMLSASRSMQKFSKGRYSLIREDLTGGGERRGLDIVVVDAHTGGSRPVSTLSGGEMFLASLSLAFGLAEVVQSYAGGVQLDSIFIDEGFGSLDAQTLDSAMMALADIQSEGRLVGIISHVSELKERIASRIELEPSAEGTSLCVKTGE
ncbi:MAG TPA: hypothetical protein DEQ02_08275 [Ruminococcaceae bacterium]|nr:hypothetical protein [Oscillospiraceae bacterium]